MTKVNVSLEYQDSNSSLSPSTTPEVGYKLSEYKISKKEKDTKFMALRAPSPTFKLCLEQKAKIEANKAAAKARLLNSKSHKNISSAPPTPSSSVSPSGVSIKNVVNISNGRVQRTGTESSTIVQVVRGNIVKEATDAIVNAANRNLRHGAGVAGYIRRGAGYQLVKESQAYIAKNGPVAVGSVAVTGPGNLASKCIIHAVGPQYDAARHKVCCKQLESSVKSSLIAADRRSLKSISLPAISIGIFGFPKQKCADIIVQSIIDEVKHTKHLKLVRIVVIDTKTLQYFLKAYDRLFKQQPLAATRTTSTVKPVSRGFKKAPEQYPKKPHGEVVWQWKHDLSSSMPSAWRSYSPSESRKIEDQYQRDSNGSVQVSGYYRVDLKNMVQCRIGPEVKRRPVRRKRR
ncbi:hypothetical protein AAMO2058_000447000 [Amorphochlora amoebiformis]